MAGPPELEVYPDAQSLAVAVARYVVAMGTDALERRGRFDLALAGGTTPKAAYAFLATELRDALDWNLVRFFFGDERCVPPEDEQSNFRMAREALLDPLGVRPYAVFRILGEGEPAEAARAYADTLRHELGREPILDLVLLGMGPDGHTASLFPGEDPATDDTALVRAPWVEKLKARRITLTPHVFNAARRVAIATEGIHKAAALAAVLEGPQEPTMYPLQAIAPRQHAARFFVDRAAAGALSSPAAHATRSAD